MPKKGSFTGKFGWYAVGKVTELEKGRLFFTGEFSGVFFNDKSGGALDGIGVQCPGVNEIIFGADGGKSVANGVCTLIDMEGDRIYSRWAISGSFPVGTEPADWEFTGGTGKYAGIKATGRFDTTVLAPTNSGFSIWNMPYELP
jgi:hypothetical protein